MILMVQAKVKYTGLHSSAWHSRPFTTLPTFPSSTGFSPHSLNDLLAFIHAVPTVQHAVPSHSTPTKLFSSSPRAGSEVPAP